VRESFKITEVEKKYPFKYEESMNSVLLQELARYNTLIEEIKSSLHSLILTLQGKQVMNTEIERMLNSIVNNSIPDKWRARSYPSRKSLLSYIRDLSKRLQMLEDWIQNGQPSVFWISGFFFT
jgi:dynein heavy chain, axonemal